MSELFRPWTKSGVTARNRIVVSPMCQYSAVDGLPTPWHQVHLGSRAVGGAGIVFTEASAVTAQGRISPHDLGIWSETHRDAVAPIAAFIREAGAVPAMQLAHAGRKASTAVPWEGRRALGPAEGGWPVIAPSAIPFDAGSPVPKVITIDEITELRIAFARAARFAHEAGFEIVELHGAHGYLLHEFLSPLSNERTDAYGGSFEGRIKFVVEVVDAVRGAWPERKPLWMRLSCTDWIEGGWTVDETVALARILREHGVDAIDCSSGGTSDRQQIVLGPGYQVPFASRVRNEAGIASVAVGMIEDFDQAEAILRDGDADAIAMARAFLRDPYWPLHAALHLGVDVPWPVQYERAKPRPVRAARAV